MVNQRQRCTFKTSVHTTRLKHSRSPSRTASVRLTQYTPGTIWHGTLFAHARHFFSNIAACSSARSARYTSSTLLSPTCTPTRWSAAPVRPRSHQSAVALPTRTRPAPLDRAGRRNTRSTALRWPCNLGAGRCRMRRP